MINQDRFPSLPQITELPFIGRERELRELIEHFDAALDYQGRMVLIQGEAGVGKTRLIEEFANLPELSRAIRLKGRCFREEVGSYNPFPKMVLSYLERTDKPSYWATRLIDKDMFSYFLTISPQLKAYYPFEVTPIPPPNQQIIYSCFLRIFDNLVSLKPLILLIDDALWMGREASELLEFISIQLSDKPILIVSITRPYKRGSDFDKMLSNIAERRLLSIIELGNLEKEEVEELLKIQFGPPETDELRPDFSKWLYRISKGNPLFISEILKTLQYRNILRVYQGRYEITGNYRDIPPSRSIESIIGLELQDLRPEEEKILQKVAVIGEKFEIPILRALFPRLADRDILSFLHRMRAIRILKQRESNIYQFTHPLLQKVLYQRIEKDTRRKTHRRIARILKRLNNVEIKRIVYHLTQDLEPGEGNLQMCRDILKAAGIYELKYDFRQAARYYRLAQRIGEQISHYPKKDRLLIQASNMLLSSRLGAPICSCDELVKIAEETKKEGLKKLSFTLSIEAFRWYSRELKYEEAKTSLQEAIHTPKIPEICEEREKYYEVRAKMIDHLMENLSDYRAAKREALRLLDEIDSDVYPDAYWGVLCALGNIYSRRGDFGKAIGWYKKAHSLTPYLPYHRKVENIFLLGIVLTALGRYGEAKEQIKEFLSMSQKMGNKEDIVKGHIHLGNCHFNQGYYSEALQLFRNSLILSQDLNTSEGIIFNRQKIVEILLRLQDLSQAETEISELWKYVEMSNFPKKNIVFIYTLITYSHFYFEKQDFSTSLQCIRDAFTIAKEIKAELCQGVALGRESLIFLRLGDIEKAWDIFREAKRILCRKKALAALPDLLIRFGLNLDGEKGEEIFLEGLEILLKTDALLRVEYLIDDIRKAKFRKALKIVEKEFVSLRKQELEKLKVYTFGGLSVKRPKEEQTISQKEWQTKKTKELLGLLLLFSEGRGTTYEILASYLWPEASSKKAHNIFYVTLNRLQKALKAEYINFDGTFYSINRDSVWVDYYEFEELYQKFLAYKAEDKLHRAEQVAQKAVELYRGDFLPEIYLLPMDDKQIELKEKAKILFLWLSRRALDRSEYQESLNLTHKLLFIDPVNEQAHQLIMEVLYEQGDRMAALKHFDRFKSLLKKELDVGPSPEIIALHETLKGKK